jgi:hypothetical protein
MTGFIRGLFGGKKEPKAPQPPRAGGAFFLDEDEAKTFGNIDYMRSNKVIKRTFARKKGQTQEIETIRQVSALEKRELNESGITPKTISSSNFAPTSTSSFQPTQTSTTPKFEPRRTGSDMDMFRSMARDLKKKK